MEIKPITFRTACDFVALNHRHHKPTVGCKSTWRGSEQIV